MILRESAGRGMWSYLPGAGGLHDGVRQGRWVFRRDQGVKTGMLLDETAQLGLRVGGDQGPAAHRQDARQLGRHDQVRHPAPLNHEVKVRRRQKGSRDESRYMEGDYETAIAGFQKFLADYPNHQLVGAAQYWIAESFAKLEEYETAVQEYDYLIEKYPQNDKIADAYYGKGIALLQLGKFNEAKYHFTYVVEHFPGTGAAQKAGNRLEELR